MESVSPSASEKPFRRSSAVNEKEVSSAVVKPVPTGVRSAVGSVPSGLTGLEPPSAVKTGASLTERIWKAAEAVVLSVPSDAV